MTRYVDIHYVRPPDRKDVFRQAYLLDASEAKVTFAENIAFEPALRIHGRPVLENGSSIVWFTFPGRWHDVGRFHTADGTFQGLYANVLTPPVMAPGDLWYTTDLFLDVWIDLDGTIAVLDRDEFDRALKLGWLDDATAKRALQEVESLLEGYENGDWPPPIVSEWTLTRAHSALKSASD